MQLFYTPDIATDSYTLNEQESKHCIRVLRKKKGDILFLTDGLGNLYKAGIVTDNLKACQLKIVETFSNYRARNFYLHIAIAPTKNIDRIEWFLEKATEIGIDEITPLVTQHSERKHVNADRLERIIVSAMKQSVKAHKPVLNGMTTFSDFISQKRPENICCIAHCNPGEKKLMRELYNKHESCAILIGPEGNFSLEEVGQAISRGYQQVSLGESRLRTETAGVVACHTISFLNY
jgi:16S rRNA (uracil1498-N3)-methyltransferase